MLHKAIFPCCRRLARSSCFWSGAPKQMTTYNKVRCTNPYNCSVEVASRILAIDYGSRRMGLAVSDLLGITAQGIDTLQRRNKKADFARLGQLIRQYGVREIVLGYPLRMSGETGTQSQKVA